MKLKTLIEYQRCFKILREAEKADKPLSGEDYVACLSASAIFDYYLDLHLGKLPAVEVTDWSAA